MRSKPKNKNDLLIAFSGSGNSANIINAINFVKKFGVKTFCISGRGGGKASKIVDYALVIPGSSKFPGQTGKNDNNFHIEDLQNSISHILVGLLKEYVQKKNKIKNFYSKSKKIRSDIIEMLFKSSIRSLRTLFKHSRNFKLPFFRKKNI